MVGIAGRPDATVADNGGTLRVRTILNGCFDRSGVVALVYVELRIRHVEDHPETYRLLGDGCAAE